MDEYEALKKIRSLCRGKILVGHDLQMELNNLCIDKQSLLGIRDLAGAKAFHEKFNLSPKSGGQFYKLQTLATSILKIEIQQPGKHNSMEDTKAIMDLYRTIEDSYIDDIHFNHEDLRWKIPSIVGDVEHSQPKKFKSGLPAIMWPSPSIQREPIENVIMAWQDEVDLDICENLVIAQDINYETLQPAMFQSTSNSLMPSTSNYVENPERNKKSNKAKTKLSIQNMEYFEIPPNSTIKHLSIQQLEHVDIPPEPRNNIVPELQVLGETFRTTVSEIEYVSDNGHVMKWKL